MLDKIKLLEYCKNCGSNDLVDVLSLNEQYLSPTFVKSNKNNPLVEIKSRLTLVLCDKRKNKKNCGLLQLKEIIEPDLLYKEYFYRTATNDTMREDLKELVDQVIDIARPEKKDSGIIWELMYLGTILTIFEKLMMVFCEISKAVIHLMGIKMKTDDANFI